MAMGSVAGVGRGECRRSLIPRWRGRGPSPGLLVRWQFAPNSAFGCIARRCSLWSETVTDPLRGTRCLRAPLRHPAERRSGRARTKVGRRRPARVRGRTGRPASRAPRRRRCTRQPPVTHPCRDGPDLHARPTRAAGARARFVSDVLQPREVEFERAGGQMPREWGREIRRAAIEAGLHGGSLPGRSGGRAGPRWSRSSSTSSSARRPAGSGRSSRAPTTRSSTAPRRSVDATWTRPSGENGRAATRSPRPAPAPTPACSRQRPSRPSDRRVRAQRREVVRDRPGRHRLHDLPLRSRRRRRPPPDALPRRLRPPGVAPDPRSRLHPHLRRPSSRSSSSRTSASRPARSWGRGRADELTNEWFVEERIHIGARCAGAMERLLGGRSSGRPGGSSSDSGSTTSRASRSRWPTRRPTRPRRDCSPARRPGSPTRAPTPRSSTPSVDRQAVRVGGRLPLRRSGRPGLRRPRLHA